MPKSQRSWLNVPHWPIFSTPETSRKIVIAVSAQARTGDLSHVRRTWWPLHYGNMLSVDCVEGWLCIVHAWVTQFYWVIYSEQQDQSFAILYSSMPQKHLLATVWSENIWKHSNVTPRNVAHFLLQRHGISWNLKKSAVELGEIFCRKKRWTWL